MAPRIQHIPATLVYFGLLLCCRWCRSVRAKAEESTTSTFLRRTFEKDDGDGDGEDGDGENSVRKYEILSSREIRDRLLQMADQYPTLVKLTTAQEEYGLPAAGTAADCTFDNDVNGCLNYIVTLQDFVTHPEGSDTSNRLPEVLLSGEVHGNERVGSTTAIETAALLLEATSCIAYPRLEVRSDPDEWQNDLELAAACRKHAFDVYGLDESKLQWLARLVTTRRIVIVPTANALGYDRNVRTEDGIDPNRDFAFDQEPELCMQTIAARTLNEVFREHMFQMSLTFHGGIELIGYEWGNLDKIDSPISPDDVAQSLIAASYSQFGGGWTQSPEYEYGPMNSILYPVYGGMEDWAYAASWDSSLAVKCQPTTYGGYPIEKTTYDDSTLRAFNMLIETSTQKTPPSNTLGSTADIMNPRGESNGHVSRNLRLSLLSIEVVQPWSSFRRVNELSLSEDLIPLTVNAVQRDSCQSAKRVRVPSDENLGNVSVEWKVGGAFTVDQTTVFYALWNAIPADLLDCLHQPSYAQLQGIMKEGMDLSRESGNTEFDPATSDTGTFSAVLDFSMYQPNDEIVVLAMVRVDQEWATTPSNSVPAQVPPQSHIVNVRTNEEWHHEKSSGKVIQGRLNWFSEPLTIEIGSSSMSETIELSKRE